MAHRRRRYVRRRHDSNSNKRNNLAKTEKVKPARQESTKMVASSNKDGINSLLDLESLNRLTSLPIVESGRHLAENAYYKIKKSHSLLHWTLEQAETSVHTAIDSTLPALVLFKGPILSIDKIVCRSLDVVEDRFPSITLPPEMIYWNTKQYVADVGTRIVRPVLKRADSVKHIGETVLASKYTAFAADTLDGALNVADKYVDKYLPEAEDEHNNYDANKNESGGPKEKAFHTIQHVGRFSGKLQRRLTRRTLAEAKALKDQSADAIHVLIYVAELVATDPKLAFTKGKELWLSLSQDEPENQARPENLEQLIVLLTRESARRVVHFINFTSEALSKIPKNATNSALKILHFVDSIVKSVHLEGVQRSVLSTLKNRAHHFTVLLRQLNVYITDLLDTAAQSLDDEQPNAEEQQKSGLEVPRIKVQLRAVHQRSKNSNGVEGSYNN